MVGALVRSFIKPENPCGIYTVRTREHRKIIFLYTLTMEFAFRSVTTSEAVDKNKIVLACYCVSSSMEK